VPRTENSNGHRKKIALLIILFLIVGSVAGYRFWTKDRITTDDAYVDGHIYTIAPRINGYVTRVHVTDNQPVEKGQILVTLDAVPFETALAEAEAQLAEAESTLISMELSVPLERTQTTERVKRAEAEMDGLRQTLAMIEKQKEAAAQSLREMEAEHQKALLDLKRMKTLREGDGISQAMLDDVDTRSRTVYARMLAARARLEAVEKQKDSVESDIERIKADIKLAGTGEKQAIIKSHQARAQQARVDLAQARRRQAELDVSYTVITAPASGYITRKSVEPGKTVSKGQPLMALVPLAPEDVWITANFKETQLTDIRPGQPVAVQVDTYPGRKFQGTVDSIMAGTGTAFSLFPPENASGNFVKVVQRIPVKIHIDPDTHPELPVLRIGMSVVPTVFTDR